ncbi:MAG: winged helix-turn-helix domain-containing protein [Candidatus Thorarchaeota archaeon]
MIEASLEEVRRLVLDSQGLRTDDKCKSVMDVAHRIHNIQIDTISVVSRSHNLTTFNRFEDYLEGEVWESQRKGELFEFWSHALCLMPMESYPFYAWKVGLYRTLKDEWMVRWGLENKETVDAVLDYAKKNGPVSSSSFENKREKRSGWWDWKAEKRALEYLHLIGHLLVAHRQGFHKQYDLTERVLPPGLDSEPMPEKEIPLYLAKTLLSSQGVACAKDLRHYFGWITMKTLWDGKTKNMENFLVDLSREGVVDEVSIDSIKDRFFVLSENAEKLLGNQAPQKEDDPVKFLSPFDNIIRERHFPEKLWQFEYKLESYVPADKRKFGYYVLPILDGVDLVGRTDAKVHRKVGLLEVKSLFLETDFWKEPEGILRFANGLKQFADFHDCSDIKLGKVSPRGAKSQVKGGILNFLTP